MRKLILLLLGLYSLNIQAQEDLLAGLEEENDQEEELVEATFKSPYLINFPTVENEKKGLLDFRIVHRFGNVGGNSGGGHSLWGIDQASNIRFSLDYGITDKIQVGIGRSKTNEHIDGLFKYKILSQTKNKMPLSLLVNLTTAYTPKKDINGFFSKEAHRFSHSAQVIVGRKFNSRLSLLLIPTYTHRNLVINSENPDIPKDQNDLFSLGLGGRLKLNKKISVVGEYYYTFGEYQNSSNTSYIHPFSVGVEIETGGHVFHINACNASGIINQDLIPTGGEDWLEGEFKLGFTISRVFYLHD